MRQKKNQRREKAAEAPKLTAEQRAFERETERRRREMLRTLAQRTAPIQNKHLKGALWKSVSKDIRAVMRAKPVRHAPRGS